LNVVEVLLIVGAVIFLGRFVNDDLFPIVRDKFKKRKDEANAKINAETRHRPIGELISDMDRKYRTDREQSGAGTGDEE